MSLRSGLRLVMLALAITVAALVVLQWRGGSEAPDGEVSLPEVETAEVQSRTEGLNYTYAEFGVPRYEIRADQSLGFANGRNLWRGAVELVLYAEVEREGEMPEPTVVTGEEMRTLKRGTDYQEVAVEGNVHTALQGGAEVESPELVYRRGSSAVRTDAGVVVRYAGLLIRAKSLRYQTEARRLRLWNQLTLSADPAGSGTVPEGLDGRASELIYHRDLSGVRLEGNPLVRMPEATISGGSLMLDVEEETNRLRGIEARGQGRVRWTGAAASGEHILEGDGVTVELGEDQQPRVAWSQRTSEGQPRLRLGGSGELSAGRIELLLQGNGRGRVEATGGARWEAGADETDLTAVQALSLSLQTGPAGLETADGRGSVRVQLSGANGQGASLQGPRVLLEWRRGRLFGGDWPDGVRYTADGRRLEASEGSYDPTLDRWIMEGTRRPRLEDERVAVEADQIGIEVAGQLTASGNVRATLRGSQLKVMGPIFGKDGPINVGSSALRIDEGDRLEFSDGARLWKGQQMLSARVVSVSDDPTTLQASGAVLVTLSRSESGEGEAASTDSTINAGAAGPGPPDRRQEQVGSAGGEPGRAGSSELSDRVQLSGGQLLIEGEPPEMRLVDGAQLQDGERRISGAAVVVEFGEEEGWNAIEVEGGVSMEDPDGSAQGERLHYDPSTGVVTVFGTQGTPAVFTNDEGVDIRDPQGLRLEWTAGELKITALQQGTTQTVRTQTPQ